MVAYQFKETGSQFPYELGFLTWHSCDPQDRDMVAYNPVSAHMGMSSSASCCHLSSMGALTDELEWDLLPLGRAGTERLLSGCLDEVDGAVVEGVPAQSAAPVSLLAPPATSATHSCPTSTQARS